MNILCCRTLDDSGLVVVGGKIPPQISGVSDVEVFLRDYSQWDLRTCTELCLKVPLQVAKDLRQLVKANWSCVEIREMPKGDLSSLVRVNTAVVPVAIDDVQGDARWSSIYQRHVETARAQSFESLLIGDSLVQQMELSETWETLERFKPLNFGIGGDEVQHALWRFKNARFGEFVTPSSPHPKVVVILVGTNNHKHTAGEAVEGIKNLVQEIQATWPSTAIIVVVRRLKTPLPFPFLVASKLNVASLAGSLASRTQAQSPAAQDGANQLAAEGLRRGDPAC